MQIDLNKLQRNYTENPLKKGEYPELQDIIYLFLELNLSREECAEVCNCNPEKVKIVCQRNNLKKTNEQRTELRKRTTLKKHGVENISQLKEIKEKKQQTCLSNYGVKNPAQSKQIQEKMEKTCLEKYGVTSTNKLEEKKQLIKNTVQEKYGVDNVMQNEEIKLKLQQTFIERYGETSPQKVPEIKQKTERTRLEKYGKTNLFGTEYFKEKTKETLIEKYNVENPMNIPEVQEKVRQNVENVRRKILEKMPQTLLKIYETKRKNNSFNTSKPEDDCYELLLTKFPDVLRQYRSEKYPFNCDFYIPSLDLYIECNFNWTHGPAHFNSENQEHLALLEIWKEKSISSDYFMNAIYTWTELDVKKFKTAIDNNLNYFCFYDCEQFLSWFDN